MVIEYTPKGVCARRMTIEVEDGIIKSVNILGGCNGNANGFCSILPGMEVQHVIDRLEGTRCGFKPTSCPDQIAQALKQAL